MTTQKIHFDLLIPFMPPFPYSERGHSAFMAVGEELVGLLQTLNFAINPAYCSNLSVDTTISWDWAEDDFTRVVRGRFRLLRKVAPVRIQGTVDGDIAAFRADGGEELQNFKNQQIAQLLAELLEEEVAREAAKVLFAACLARPGSFQTEKGFASAGGMLSEYSCLAFRPELDWQLVATEYGWPPISELSLEEVYQWFNKVPGFLEGEGRGPVGRAVSALSYMLSPQHQVAGDVIWPLIGLEALYCRGTQGLARQILEKSELFLGPRTEFQANFRRIYSARSRFLHGEVDLPLAQSEGFAENDSESALLEPARLAGAILIASLQKLVREGRVDLEFRQIRTEVPGK